VDREAAKKIKRDFGQRLRAIRKDKGLSQETLALMCGLDRTYIGGVERGERNISLVNIYKIGRALKIKPEVLLQ
jgi:transcriptional regulator with XRE-family HTH domain